MRVDIPASISFSEYAKLPYYAEDILEYFGYKLEKRVMVHVRSDLIAPTTAFELKTRIGAYLPYVSLANEMGRREFLIAPILIELALSLRAQIRTEYPLRVSEQLRGSLDYLLELNNDFIVIEAKDENLQKGFTQLAIEMIALSQAEDKPVVRGAVSIGTIWQFAMLHVGAKTVIQDLNLYRVPNDLEDVLQILAGGL